MGKNLGYSLLLDIYAPLLTERQAELLSLYYNEDLSLAEIAEDFGISRQGAHDIIRRAEAALDDAEKKLGLLAKENRLRGALEKAAAAAASLPGGQGREDITARLREALDILED